MKFNSLTAKFMPKLSQTIGRFVKIVKESSSYEEFLLACRADEKLSNLLDKLCSCWVGDDGRLGEITPSELYGTLKAKQEEAKR